MARNEGRGDAAGLGHGDRVVLLGIGQTRGKHADVLSIRGVIATVVVDDIGPLLTLSRDIHPIPRRPKPDF